MKQNCENWCARRGRYCKSADKNGGCNLPPGFGFMCPVSFVKQPRHTEIYWQVLAQRKGDRDNPPADA